MTNSVPRRGQLKYSINTSSHLIEAGKEFSVSVSVTNPFDVPVNLKSVTTKLPIEFVDVAKERLENQKMLLEDKIKRMLKTKIPTVNIQEEKEKKRKLLLDVSKEFMRMIPFLGSAFAAGTALTEYIRASNMTAVATIDHVADSVTVEDIQRIAEAVQAESNPEAKLQEEMIRILSEKVNSLRQNLEQPILLQPGNSTVQVFTIRTNKSILFTPSSYTLHIEIQYGIEDLINQDVLEYSLSIGTSLGSLIFGSIIGSSMGYVVKDIFKDRLIFKLLTSFDITSAGSYFLILVANIILGVITVIVFARKKEVQPILAIEDFWGGILLGFIVGYTGKSFIEKILPQSAT
jgi:hypothetical protein